MVGFISSSIAMIAFIAVTHFLLDKYHEKTIFNRIIFIMLILTIGELSFIVLFTLGSQALRILVDRCRQFFRKFAFLRQILIVNQAANSFNSMSNVAAKLRHRTSCVNFVLSKLLKICVIVSFLVITVVIFLSVAWLTFYYFLYVPKGHNKNQQIIR